MRMWRTQVHFLEESDETKKIRSKFPIFETKDLLFELPAWDVGDILSISKEELPPELAAVVKPGYRCHAHVTLAARRVEDLSINHWELT